MRSGFLIWIELRMWDPSKWFEIDKGEIYREREGERGREREREEGGGGTLMRRQDRRRRNSIGWD